MRLPRDAAENDKGWNSYGAEPTTEAAILTAETITQWVPMNNGGLCIEATIGDSEVGIEINPDGQVASVSWFRRIR